MPDIPTQTHERWGGGSGGVGYGSDFGTGKRSLSKLNPQHSAALRSDLRAQDVATDLAATGRSVFRLVLFAAQKIHLNKQNMDSCLLKEPQRKSQMTAEFKAQIKVYVQVCLRKMRQKDDSKNGVVI